MSTAYSHTDVPHSSEVSNQSTNVMSVRGARSTSLSSRPPMPPPPVTAPRYASVPPPAAAYPAASTTDDMSMSCVSWDLAAASFTGRDGRDGSTLTGSIVEVGRGSQAAISRIAYTRRPSRSLSPPRGTPDAGAALPLTTAGNNSNKPADDSELSSACKRVVHTDGVVRKRFFAGPGRDALRREARILRAASGCRNVVAYVGTSANSLYMQDFGVDSKPLSDVPFAELSTRHRLEVWRWGAWLSCPCSSSSLWYSVPVIGAIVMRKCAVYWLVCGAVELRLLLFMFVWQ